MSSSPPIFAGLMSGTSLDGIDVALVQVEGRGPADLEVRMMGFQTVSHDTGTRDRILRIVRAGALEELARLDRDLAVAFAEALLGLLRRQGIAPSRISAVGSHGQTVWHDPPTRTDSASPGCTLQIGCPHTLAERTGISVVGDLRSRDMAAGGHGAPLVPWADWILFRRSDRGRALQNLGGMGNVTFLPAGGGADGVRAFDTGPGVALLDAAARRASGGREAWDVDGRRALRGEPDDALLAELLEDPFFGEPPPRSTGRERFGARFVKDLVDRTGPRTESDWNDLLATLTRLTARSVALAYRDFLPSQQIDEVVLTGGGAHNPALVRALEAELAPIPVRIGADALGLDPDAREAVAFALLAWAHLQGIPGNLPRVTGARGPRVLGSLTPGGLAGRPSPERP